MKIAACLPSFNESQNIKNITQIVDRGLVSFGAEYQDAQIEIINIDSDSADHTADIFLATNTYCSKRSIVIKGALGKGRNLLEFCKYVVKNNIDYCLTIDTDIISATPDWIFKLLTPLMNNGADYVTPIYERSRFEGSSTNHFAFPLVYALFGKVIRQPIAGDFAFSRKIAQAIVGSSLASNESIQRYGIDIFMTCTALATDGLITQVDLGKKLHAPSFNKLEYMFPQIAASTLLCGSTMAFSSEVPEVIGDKSNILPDLNFIHREAARTMKNRALEGLKSIRNREWMNEKILTEFISIAQSDVPNETKMAGVWVDVLSNWVKFFLKPSLVSSEAKYAGQELLSFFVLRATNFWFWAETVKVADVEKALKRQAELLRDKTLTT